MAAGKGMMGKLAAPFATKAVGAGAAAGAGAAGGAMAGPLGGVWVLAGVGEGIYRCKCLFVCMYRSLYE